MAQVGTISHLKSQVVCIYNNDICTRSTCSYDIVLLTSIEKAETFEGKTMVSKYPEFQTISSEGVMYYSVPHVCSLYIHSGNKFPQQDLSYILVLLYCHIPLRYVLNFLVL